MNDQAKTKQQLIEENEELRRRVAAMESGEAERSRREEELRLSEAKWRSLVENAPLFMMIVDRSGRMQFLNRYRPGFEPATVLGKHFCDFIQPEYHEVARNCLAQVFQTGEPAFYENVGAGAEGGSAYYSVDVGPLFVDGEISAATLIARDITDRKRDEEAVRRAEAKYRQLHEGMRDAFVSVTMDGRIQEYNEAYRQMLGYEPEELAALTFWDVTPGKWHAFQKELFEQQVFARGYSGLYEKEYRRKDGTVFPVELRTILLRDDQGQPSGMWAIIRDITERKRAEEALRESEQRMALHVQQTPLGAIEWDLEFRVMRWNPGAERIFGYAEGEALGHHAAFIIAPSARGHVDGVWKDLVAQKGGKRSTNENITKDGRLILCEWYNTPLVDAEGRVIGVASLVEDITERVRAQQKLQKAHRELEQRVAERTAELTEANEQLRREAEERQQVEEALQQSESRYRELVENQGEGVGIVDPQEYFTFANPAGERIFGVPPGKLAGHSLREFMSEKQYALMLEQTKKRQAGETSTYELEITRPDGEIRNLLVTAVPKIDKMGQFIGALGLFFDITELKQAQKALHREYLTTRHLLQSSDHERQLIAYEIHDGLAQQLAGAIMQLDTYAHQTEKEPKFADGAFQAGMTMLRHGHSEARRLISGVRPPILDEAGVVAAIAHLVNEERHQKGPKIEYLSDVGFERLNPTLENAIYRIAQEGLTNACRHSKSEKVRVELVQQGDRVRIEIQDEGIGFKPDAIEEGNFGVAGIRVRSRLLGGSAVIDSEPGKGTRIVAELPVLLRREEAES